MSSYLSLMSAGMRPRMDRWSNVRGGRLARFGVECAVFLPAHLLAARLAKLGPFFRVAQFMPAPYSLRARNARRECG